MRACESALLLLLLLTACNSARLDSVVALDRDAAPYCLGAAIAERWVVTAKHCVVEGGRDLVLELPRFTAIGSQGDSAVVAAHVIGGRWDGLRDLHGRDLALLELEKPIARTYAIFGEADAIDDVIQIDGAMTERESRVVHREGRALFTDRRTHEGDSGGPLFTPDGAVVGVASWASDTTALAAFTRTDAHRVWIDSIVRP